MYLFRELGMLGSYINTFLITVKFVRLICRLNNTPVVSTISVTILGFIFVPKSR
jgi:hypothetical protein